MASTDSQDLPALSVRHASARPGWPTRLSAEVWLHRHGWALPAIALLAMIAGALAVLQIGPAQRESDLLSAQLQSTRARALPAPAVVEPMVPEPGQQLRNTLGNADAGPSQVKQIVEIARLHGIKLPRAQYAKSRQAPSGIEHTDITFSFVAAYPRTRDFVEDVLRALPNASVDRLSFERDQAQGADTEVTLRLTLWRWPAAPQLAVKR